MVSDRAPVYLSARSADDILSEIRPTRLKGDALQSVNGFLDEILFLILQTARSLSPTRLRDGLLKLLPTPLGKEAVLEAEMELRNHRERGATSTAAIDEVSAKDFPLQVVFELLRLKCEACSTLNEADEDAEAESKLVAKLTTSSAIRSPGLQPAVFYLTAILEHLCQHILSSVGRVVARDSSRSIASSHDLFVALCEDETIYSLFTRMKIHETINAQSTLAKPRRSKSFSQSGDFTANSLRNGSPIPSQEPRSTILGETAPRTSLEKTRARIFKGSSQESSNGHDHGLPPVPHKRSHSSVSNHRSTDKHDDGGSFESDSSPSSQNFDDHLRSGETMKFSLTPDRLQSMEAFNRQKSQKTSPQPTSPTRNTTTPAASNPSPNRAIANGRSKRNPVEAIDEGEEDIPPVPNQKSHLPSPLKGIQSSTPSGPMNGQWVAPPPRTLSRAENTGDTTDIDGLRRPTPPSKLTQPHNRESLDLDDIMNGTDHDSSKPNLTPKNPTAARSSTRELMDFLADGPPEEFTSGPQSPQDLRKGGGRFRSMVSRLRSRSSSEQLVGRTIPTEMGVASMSLKNKNSASGLANNPRPPKFNGSTAPTSFQDPSPVAASQSLPPRARVPSAARKAPPEWPNGTSEPPSLDTDERDTGTVPKTTLPSTKNLLSSPSNSPTSISPMKDDKGKVDVTGSSRSSPTTRQPNGHTKPNIDTTKVGSQISKESVIELRQILRQAETAVECRLLVDMFLAKSGLSSARPTPSPEPVSQKAPEIADSALMDLMLGSS